MKKANFANLCSIVCVAVILTACNKPPVETKKEASISHSFEPVSVPSLLSLLDPEVYASEYSSFVIQTDRTLYASGNNQYGQLGDGTTINRSVPVRIMGSVKTVAPGRYHTLILRIDSTLWVVGRNNEGQLGTGNLEEIHTPVKIADNVIKIAAGDAHSMYLYYDRINYKYGPYVYVSGSNASGQLGCDCDSTRFLQFTRVAGSTINVKAGSNFSFLIYGGGGYTVGAAGANNLGQLGDGSNINRRSFVRVGTGALDIACGQAHTLLLKADGSLFGTGYNGFGQLGDGSSQRRNTFQPITDNVWKIAAGYHQSLFVSMNNTRELLVMGSNSHGQLGINSTENQYLPVVVALSANNIAGGGYNSYYTTDDRNTRGTGYNFYGQLGTGDNINRFVFSPMRRY